MSNGKKSKQKGSSSPFDSLSSDGRRISEEDIVSKFDANRDGVLDAKELHVLSEQLTNQLQYNNTLLAQIQSLEQENFSLQQELHSQREMIKNSTRKHGEAANESADLQRKLKLAQGIVDNLSKQLRDCRLENDLLKKDSENVLQSSVMARIEVDNMKKDLQVTKKQLTECEKVKNRALEENRQQKIEHDFKLNSLQSKNESLAKEIVDLKSKADESEKQQNDLMTRYKELSQPFNELTKKFDTEQFARQIAERKLNALSSNYETMQGQLVEKDMLIHDLKEKVETLSNKLRLQAVDTSSFEERIRELEDSLIDHQLSAKSLLEERAILQKNEEKQKAEFANELKRQRLDLERQLQAVTEKHLDGNRALTELHKQTEESLAAAQQKLIETYKAKALAEESCKAMQSQLDEAKQHAESILADHKLQLNDFALQKSRLEETIADLQRQLLDAKDSVQVANRRLMDEKDVAQAGLKTAKQKLQESNDKSIETLTTIQEAVRALGEEASEGRDRLRDVNNQVNFLRKRAAAQAEGHSLLLESLRKEMALSFKALKAKNDSLRDAKEKLIDQLRTEQLAKEEELGRNLLLEEQVSRLEHEASQTQKRLTLLERETASIHQKHSSVADQLAEDKRALQEKVAELMRAQEESAAKLRQAQEDLRKTTTIIDERNKLHAAHKNDLEEKLAKISAQLNEVQREKDQELKLSASLVRKNEQLELQLSQFSGERSAMLAQLERMRKDQQDQLLQQQRALSSVGGATQQYHNQIKQTQELLKVVQTQKAELQTQNTALRNELNEFYNSNAAVRRS